MGNREGANSDTWGRLAMAAVVGLPVLAWFAVDPGSAAGETLLRIGLPTLALGCFVGLYTRSMIGASSRSVIAALGFLWSGIATLAQDLSLLRFFGRSAGADPGTTLLVDAVFAGLLLVAGEDRLLRGFHRRASRAWVAAAVAGAAAVLPFALPRFAGFGAVDGDSTLPTIATAAIAGTFLLSAGRRLKAWSLARRPVVLGLGVAAAAAALRSLLLSGWGRELGFGGSEATLLGFWIFLPPLLGALAEDIESFGRAFHARLRVSLMAVLGLVVVCCAGLAVHVDIATKGDADERHLADLRAELLSLRIDVEAGLSRTGGPGDLDAAERRLARIESLGGATMARELGGALARIDEDPEAVRRRIEAAATAIERRGADLASSKREDAGERVRVLVVLIVCVAAGAGLLVTLASRDIVRRLESLFQATRSWASGDVSVRVAASGHDELDRVGRAFNLLVEALELRAEEHEILADTVRGSREAIAVLDARGRFRFANAAFEARTGWRTVDLVGRPYARLLSDRDGAVAEDLARGLEERGRFDSEIHLRGRAGEVVLRLAAVRVGPAGATRGFIAVHRDPDSERLLERERAAYTRHLLSINRTAEETVGHAEADEARRAALTALKREFGADGRIWRVEEPVGDGPRRLRLAASTAGRAADDEEVLLEGQGLAGRVVVTGEPLMCGDPALAPRLFAAPTRGTCLVGPQGAFPLLAQGRVVGVLEMTLPVVLHQHGGQVYTVLANILSSTLGNAELYARTREQAEELERIRRRLERSNARLQVYAAEQRKINDRLEQADRARTLFLSTASHELRTPVSAVLGLLRLLLDGAARDEEDGRKLLGEAHRCGEHLLGVVNDILDVARIEAGRLDIERADCDVAILFAETRSLSGVDRIDKDLRVRFEDPGELAVFGDRRRIEQILVNLVGNAVKFTDEGEVRISAKEDPLAGWVEFRVEDTGVGLDPGECERVFEHFVQADGGDSRRFGGTGLGLAICRRLARMMGGTLRLETRGPGRGCTAVLTLPRDRARHPMPEEPRLPAVVPPLGRVLLVDGDGGALEAAAAPLVEAGWQVLFADTARAAHELAIATEPDFVLTEFSLPHESSDELRTGVDLGLALLDTDGFRMTRFALLSGLDRETEPLRSTISGYRDLDVLRKGDGARLVGYLEGRRPVIRA